MSFKYPLIVLAALLIAHPVFADEDMTANRTCMPIVKACLNAGYKHDNGKQFWQDCMKPVVLGKSVKGITIDSKVVEKCRTAKIKQLEQELSEMKAAN